RPESTREATTTHRLLGRHGLESAVLSWSGPKPIAGLQAKARAARYRLLREECRRRGILHLLPRHHAHDQAQPAAMRAAPRGGGPEGRRRWPGRNGGTRRVARAARAAAPAGRAAHPADCDAVGPWGAVDGRPLEPRSALRAGEAALERCAPPEPAGSRRSHG